MPTLYQTPSSEDRPIWDIWLSLHHLPAMAVADELGIFQTLEASTMTAPDLAKRCGLDERATDVLLCMLASLGLLRAKDHRYELTDVARTYLLPSSPNYWGPLLQALGVVPVLHHRLIAALTANTATRGARPDASPADRGTERPSEAWIAGQMSAELATAVTRVMHCHSLPAAVAVARSKELAGVTRLLDVGGGSGCFAIAIAQNNPGTHCTVMELPAVGEITRRYIADGGVAARVDVVAVDMFRETWPSGHDAIFFSNVFHDWSAETNQQLAAAAFAVLPSGGKIFLHEMLIDDTGDGPRTSASFSLLMLLTTAGKQYSLRELTVILEGAGFRDVGSRPSYGYYSVVSATKP